MKAVNVSFHNCNCPHVTRLKKLMHHFSASAHFMSCAFLARPTFRLIISISENFT